jgi:hypothetical protein
VPAWQAQSLEFKITVSPKKRERKPTASDLEEAGQQQEAFQRF